MWLARLRTVAREGEIVSNHLVRFTGLAIVRGHRRILGSIKLSIVYVKKHSGYSIGTVGCVLFVKAIADFILLVADYRVVTLGIVSGNPTNRVLSQLPNLVYVEGDCLCVEVDNLNGFGVVGVHGLSRNAAQVSLSTDSGGRAAWHDTGMRAGVTRRR